MAQFDVGTDIEAVSLLGNASFTLTVLSGDTLYYSDSRPVGPGSNQGTLTAGGGSQTFTQQTYVVSASRSTVQALWTAAGGGGVNQITAGTGVSLSPVGGTGVVQVSTLGGSGLPSNFRTVTTTATAAANDFMLGDATSAAFSIAPPGGPTVGQLVAVKKTDATANAVNVSGTINGDASGLAITQQGHGVVLEWAGASNWIIAATFLPSGGSTALGNSWVDLCASPYNCTPGTDITTPLQNAINAANTANLDTTLYFSKSGTYNINGAQQTGTANAVAYTGQILFPARAFTATNGPITIRIMGLTPAANFADGTPSVEPMFAGGVVLLSNATSGKIFDAISAGNPFSANPATDLRVYFENVSVRAPANPQLAAGIDGTSLGTLKLVNASIDTSNPVNGGAALTGTGTGVIFPPYNSMAVSGTTGDVQVMGWPTQVAHSEHFTVSGTLYVAYGITGVKPQPVGGYGHVCVYQRLLTQGCFTVIGPSGGPLGVEGTIDVGDIAGGFYGLNTVVNDPNNYLYGSLTVAQWNAGSPPVSSPGFPVIGAQSVRFIPHVGRTSEWPSDDFNREPSISGGNYLGTTTGTHHVWIPFGAGITQTSFQAGSGAVKATGAATTSAVVKYQAGRAGLSRVIRAIVALVGTYNAEIIINKPVSGAQTANYLFVYLSGGTVTLYKSVGGTSTSLAASAAAAVAAGNTYTVDVVVSNPVKGPYTIEVLLNGTTILNAITSGAGSFAGGVYTLAAAEIANVADTDRLATQDGIGFFSDTASSFTYFRVSTN